MKRKKYAFTAEIARRVAARSGHFTDIIILKCSFPLNFARREDSLGISEFILQTDYIYPPAVLYQSVYWQIDSFLG